MRKFAAIIAAVALIGALIFFCLKAGKFSNHEHEQFQTALWRLKHLDTNFKEGVLEARFALVDNYDDFHVQELELTQLLESLSHTPSFIHPADRGEIEKARAQYASLSQERQKLFERFKSQNAMLANSRRYLPGALDELAARLKESGATGQVSDTELQNLVGGVTRITLMRLSSPDELPEDASNRLLQLKQWAVAHPHHPESMFVRSIVQHAQNIVAGNGELDALTRRLLALPTAASVEKLFQAYEIRVAAALQQAQEYRMFLYGLAAVSLAGVAYMFWALRSANRNLERRVAERTHELAGSEERFRTLCMASPIGIYMTDAEGRCVYTNPAFQATWGLTLEESLGDGCHKVIHADDRESVLKDWAATTKTGAAFTREFRLQPPGQPLRWVSSQAAAIGSSASKITGFVGTVENISERKRAEAELEAIHKQLLDTSRRAGMAEVATEVLHNVGNVLNSVNVSSALVANNVKKSKAVNLAKVVTLLRDHENRLGEFFTNDPKGKQLPSYISQLADHLANERTEALQELTQLQNYIEHINDIVSKQQSHAVVSGVAETINVSELVDDALHLHTGSLTRDQIETVREISEVTPLSVEKHKVFQILVNLISNAKIACDDSGRTDKRMTVRVTERTGRVQIAISDNGVGIPPENLVRIFNHGFTTRKQGHGFGLHSGALAAKQLGGELRAHSDGIGRGATFTLELPSQKN